MSNDTQKLRKAPPFDPGKHAKPCVQFFWWSWHPRYPYWSKSCWRGETEDEAWEVRADVRACKMNCYHNKLIREGDGTFTEVADDPPRDTTHWPEEANS